MGNVTACFNEPMTEGVKVGGHYQRELNLKIPEL